MRGCLLFASPGCSGERLRLASGNGICDSPRAAAPPHGGGGSAGRWDSGARGLGKASSSSGHLRGLQAWPPQGNQSQACAQERTGSQPPPESKAAGQPGRAAGAQSHGPACRTPSVSTCTPGLLLAAEHGWAGGSGKGGFVACAWGRPVAATQPSPPGQSGTRSCRCRPQDTGKVVGLRLGCPLEPWQGPSGTARVDPPGQRMKTFLKVQPRPGTRGTRPEMRAGEAHPCKPRTLGPSPPETESWGLAGKPAPQTDLGQG